MSAEVSPPFNFEASRAHWLRSEAMVLLDELCRDSMTEATELTIARAEQMRAMTTVYDFQESSSAAEALTRSWTGNIHNLVNTRIAACDETALVSLAKRLAWNTFYAEETSRPRYIQEDLGRVINEGLRTMAHFPLTLISCMKDYATENQLPFDGSYQGIARTLRTKTFQDMCETAATTANGVWANAGLDQINPSDLKVRLAQLINKSFVDPSDYLSQAFTVDPDTQEIVFSGAITAGLRQELRVVNIAKSALSRPSFGASAVELPVDSSGCPVRHDRPSFVQESATDHQAIKNMEVLFGTTAQELTRTRPESLIRYGLLCLADIFDAMGQMNENKQSTDQVVS